MDVFTAHTTSVSRVGSWAIKTLLRKYFGYTSEYFWSDYVCLVFYVSEGLWKCVWWREMLQVWKSRKSLCSGVDADVRPHGGQPETVVVSLTTYTRTHRHTRTRTHSPVPQLAALEADLFGLRELHRHAPARLERVDEELGHDADPHRLLRPPQVTVAEAESQRGHAGGRGEQDGLAAEPRSSEIHVQLPEGL